MKVVFQLNQMDCAPACLATVSLSYGKNIDLTYIREKCVVGKDGVSLWGLRNAATELGYEAVPIKLSLEKLTNDQLPCILHWKKSHYVVLYEIKENYINKRKSYKIADPGYGLHAYKKEAIEANWADADHRGIALLMEPTEAFFEASYPHSARISLGYLLRYLKPYWKQVMWMLILLFIGTVISIGLPILTQRLIDEGVGKKNLSFTVNILIAQLAFFAGTIVISVARNWIALLLGTRINIDIISDFIVKTLKLPLKYFDSRLQGDFSQRIVDHNRVENFLTSQSTITLFSMVTFTAYLFILFYYNVGILALYILLTASALGWSLYWMNKRKLMDHLRFQMKGESQQAVFEIVSGVTDLKLNSLEEYKSSEWTEIQKKMLKINIRILRIEQLQLSGYEFINQLKNVIVTFLTAYFVIKDELTLGMMISISFIIGQLNGPINQLITFFRSLQDAKLSMARLSEVQLLEEEEVDGLVALETATDLHDVPFQGISVRNMSFGYENSEGQLALQDISLLIPNGKVTAIVGESGSGKTTLMKLLLKLYTPTHGDIYYGNESINNISPKSLRDKCGVVMQDGFIFSDTIERNIAGNDMEIDYNQLRYAINVANINNFIEELPSKEKTIIGAVGLGMSGGQRQRIMIARAIYKKPEFLFFDEATSALDAENEKYIHEHLQKFFKGRTVVIIAHRLSTVKNADQIVVFKKGRIVEIGNHEQLIASRKEYFNLVKNQLELGK
ncbi:peptidase domain-containing ABC transporter [Sphingobacterium siyangense]|uniref:peptidase domain-containing ABC transporter n=1 Tax=Sphingobacterium siyangense TaxID=459529 RepID=UPI003016EFDA